MQTTSARRRSGLLAWTIGGVLALGLLLPWWRNHTLLRDFYDYGNVMAAAGRLQLGERPYVDFLTPIQTLQFYQAWGAETLWGAQYLSLTYVNAFFIVVSFAGFVAMLIRPLGWIVALMVSAAVVTSTAAQHSILWYNALGVAWLAAVIWMSSQGPPSSKRRILPMIVVGVALWLGGMTKLTYQAAALAFFVLFTAHAAWRKQLSWRIAGLWLAGGAFAGVLLPVLTELLLTGATWEQWKHNVLLLARSRADLLRAAGTFPFYLHTPHDYYQPLHMPFVGLWGMLLLAWMGIAAAWRQQGERHGRANRWFFVAVTVAGTAVCGVVMLAVHFEIAYFAGAAFLVMAAGIAVAFVPLDSTGPGRMARCGLVLGAVTLAIPAWISAWEGTRAIWGRGPLNRSELVSTDDLPPRFNYLRGMHILPAVHDSLVGVDARHDEYATKYPDSSYFFTNGTEWLVRCLPDARHAGMPLWMQFGTTFGESDVPAIVRRLRGHEDIQMIVSEIAWEFWHPRVETVVRSRYNMEQVRLFRIYRLRPDSATPLEDPIADAVSVQSNILLNRLAVHRGEIKLRGTKPDAFLAATSSDPIETAFGVHGMTGEMRTELLPDADPVPVEVIFRIREQAGTEAGGRVLTEQRVSLTHAAPNQVYPFHVDGSGRRIALEITRPTEDIVHAGWQKLKLEKSGVVDGPDAPWPLAKNATAHAYEPRWQAALLNPASLPITEIVAFGMDVHADGRNGIPELFCHSPGEVWVKLTQPARTVTGEFGLRDGAWTNSPATPGIKATVVFYKGGRLEVLHERELWVKKDETARGAQRFDVTLPESVGWIGLIITPLDPAINAYGHAWWRDILVRE